MVREFYELLLGREKEKDDFKHLVSHTFELCEFLIDILKVETVDGSFPHKVGLHQSCHGLRGLGLGVPSEQVLPGQTGKVKRLLESLRGIEIVTTGRSDECCGFGGTFSVFEGAVSSFIGRDRIRDYEEAGAEVIVSYDVSCLMHLDGLIRRDKKRLRVLHIAEVLNRAVA